MYVKVGKIFILGCLALGLAAGSAAVADNLYFTQDAPGGNDRLITVSGLARHSGGPQALNSQPGYLNVDTGDPGLNRGVIDAATLSTGQAVVAVGGDVVRSFDGNNINNLHGNPWDPDGAPTAGVDAIAVGDFGANSDQIVIARETGPGANDLLVIFTNANNPGPVNATAGGPAGGGTAQGLVLADVNAGHAGNEAVFAFADLGCSAGGCNGHRAIWGTGGNLSQPYLNSPITDVAAGDLTGDGLPETAFTGNNPGGGSAPGQGTHIFNNDGSFLNGPALGAPHAPPAFNTIAIGNLDADADNELVLAGSNNGGGFIRIYDNNGSGIMDATGPFQTGPAGDGTEYVDLTIADADNDGVNEVVAVTNNGLIMMFGHSTPGDATSGFAGGPIAIYQDGGGATFHGVDSLRVIPEPASALLLLLAACGLAVPRRC